MPRPPRPEPYVRRHLTLPADIDGEVELRLYSPLEARVPYGAYANLVARLLKEWLEEQRKT